MIKLKKDKFKMLFRYYSTVCNFIGISFREADKINMKVLNKIYFEEYFEYILEKYDENMRMTNCSDIEIIAISPAFNIDDVLDNKIEL